MEQRLAREARAPEAKANTANKKKKGKIRGRSAGGPRKVRGSPHPPKATSDGTRGEEKARPETRREC